MAEDDAVAHPAEISSGGRIQTDNAPVSVEHEQALGHAGQDGLEVADTPRRLDRTAPLQQFEARPGLCRHPLDEQQIVLVVGLGGIALHGEHAHGAVAHHQRHGNRRLRQAGRFSGVLHLDARAFNGPVADQTRLARADHVADKAAAERERADG